MVPNTTSSRWLNSAKLPTTSSGMLPVTAWNNPTALGRSRPVTWSMARPITVVVKATPTTAARNCATLSALLKCAQAATAAERMVPIHSHTSTSPDLGAGGRHQHEHHPALPAPARLGHPVVLAEGAGSHRRAGRRLCH